MPLAENRTNDGPETLAQSLSALSPSELRRRLRGVPSGQSASLAAALRSEASRYYHSNAATARRIARSAVITAEISGDPVALGWGHRAVAEAMLFSGRMREAEASYAAAAREWRRAGAGALLGQLLVGRIHVLALLGRMTEVERTAREARNHLEEAGDSSYLAKLSMNLGNLHFQRDHYREALREYDRAAGLFARARLRDEVTLGLETNRGVAMTHLNREEEALQVFQRLDRLCARRGLQVLQAQVKMNAAFIHSQKAAFDEALRLLGFCTDYFRQTQHPAFLASCLLNRAEIYHQLNLHSEASVLAEEAGQRFAGEGMAYDQALSLWQGALARMALGQDRQAHSDLVRARRLFLREKNAPRLALCDLLKAEMANRAGRPAAARVAAKRSLEAFARLGLVRWEAAAAVVAHRAEMAVSTGDRMIPQLRTLARRMSPNLYPLQFFRVLEALALSQEATGTGARAATTYARAVGALEDVRTRIPTEDSKIAFLGDKTVIYERLLKLELERPRPSVERLFAWMDRSRSQSLWDRLRSPAAYLERDGMKRSSSAERRKLVFLHSRVSRLELGSEEERKVAVRLRGDLKEAEQKWSRSLRLDEESDPAGSRKRPQTVPEAPARTRGKTNPPEGPGPSVIARALPPGWGFLSYHIGPERSLLVAVTKERTAWRRLPDDLGTGVTQLTARLELQWSIAAAETSQALATAQAERSGERNARAEAPRVAADGILRELHTLLWRPLTELGFDPSLHWIVSRHGPMARVPMHALRAASGYVVDQCSVVYVPSGRVWISLEDARAGRSAYVAGVPSRTLPSVAHEVRVVSRHLSRWHVETDTAPVRGTFLDRARSVNLLHLAAHGSLREDNPAFSYVELSDGPLYVYDLSGLRMKGAIVVLTACSSGRAAAPSGDEWVGLARGFLQAGASAVIAALWPIDDRAALELMDLFYASLRGRPAGAFGAPHALRRAMVTLRETRPHPWQWASFGIWGGIAPRRRSC